MLRYKIIIEYDGTNLIGMQSNNGGSSVQSLLEEAILKFSGENTTIFSSGRTDAGVHAFAMTCHFDLKKDFDNNVIINAINYYLINKPVVVKYCEKVDSNFHARFSCKKRSYRYLILNDNQKSIINTNRFWHIKEKLDINKMIYESKKLIGLHDFSSFRASKCQAKSPVKTIDTIDIHKIVSLLNQEYLAIDISAKSFLYKMVRNITGTLVDIGLGKNINITQILKSKDRKKAGRTAPAYGLYFMNAEY